MKLTLQVQLLPDEAQADKLRQTLERFNEATNWLAGCAFAQQLSNKYALQQLHYDELRGRFGLSSQMAVRAIAQVAEAYKRDKAVKPHFRPHAAVPYDARILSFKPNDRVSLLTLEGRVVLPFVMGEHQRLRFDAPKGQSDLVLRNDGKWFLLVSISLTDTPPLPSSDVLGVDLGVLSLATDSDGVVHSGADVEEVRVRYHTRRQRLQKAAARKNKRGKRPKNIRRALKRTSGREARFRRDHNHVLSKKLVAKAKGTGRGLALEDLQGIRERTRFRKPQRARMAGWAFFQLRTFITYKACIVGVRLLLVDPRNTSRTCAVCGYCDKENRRSQSQFWCAACGHKAHADINAARNIRAGAAVNPPMVSERRLPWPLITGTSSAL